MFTSKETKSNPLPTIFPQKDLLQELLLEKYGIPAKEIKPLVGYDDYNYHVIPEVEDSTTGVQSTMTYCLKVINADDSNNPDKIDAVNAVMRFVKQNGILTQNTVKTLEGQDWCYVFLDKALKQRRTVCLRTFLPGKSMINTYLPPSQLFDLGIFCGRVSSLLKEFHHPFYDTYDMSWSLDNVPLIAEKLHLLSGNEQKELVKDVLEVFNNDVKPRTDKFTKGQIHADVSPDNIIVGEPDANISGTPEPVRGLIDFHDTHSSYIMHDLAISIAHMLLYPPPDVPLLDIPGHILAGHQTVLPLNDDELDALPVCVATRLCQIVVYNEYYHRMDPDNAYLVNLMEKGWDALKEIWKRPKTALQKNFIRITDVYINKM